MTLHHLEIPVSESDVRKLMVGDRLYLSGLLVTARDRVHQRILDYWRVGRKMPVDLKGVALFHCGPVVRRIDGGWKVLAAGPTTSARMEQYEAGVLEATGVKIIVGKGGMGQSTTEAMKRLGAAYCDYTGGAAALAARAVKDIERVDWLDLGEAEAMWSLRVDSFGPAIVAVDAHGNNLHTQVASEVERRRKELYKLLGIDS